MSKFVTFKQNPTNHIYTPDAAENGTDEEKEAYSKMESEISAAIAAKEDAEEVKTQETTTDKEQ